MLRLHLSLTTHACREAVATIRCEISFGVVNWQRAQTARSGILLFTKHSNTHAQKKKTSITVRAIAHDHGRKRSLVSEPKLQATELMGNAVAGVSQKKKGNFVSRPAKL